MPMKGRNVLSVDALDVFSPASNANKHDSPSYLRKSVSGWKQH